MCGGFVGDIIDSVVDVVSDVVEGVVDVVSDIGSSIDDFVNDVIPGGWLGVAGGALLAVGIYNPTLFGLAEAGALTTEAITAAGIDAAALAEGVAAVAPEVLAATEAAITSGVAPEIIAMANATADPIAALVAAQGGSVIDTAYLASIGATPELIATAEATNVALGYTAAGTAVAETGAAVEEGLTQVFEDGSTLTTNADGTLTSVNTEGVTQNTQIFDDGSSVTTAADGSVVSSTPATGGPVYDANGNILVDAGGPGQAPVYDAPAGTPGTNNPYGSGDIPLGTAIKDYAGAVYESLGPLGTAGLLGGGALASGLIGNPGIEAGDGDMGVSPYSWGQSQELVNPGLNPGYLGPVASIPDYQTTNPTDAQYYWGVHTPVNSQEDLANYNQLPLGAPTTPWGAGKTAVGGQATLDIPSFINEYVTNPNWAGVNSATGPGYVPPMEPTQPLSMAQQAIAAMYSGAPTAELTTGPVVPA